MKRKTAQIHGYTLEVREDWDRYVPWLERICNGVGPASWPEAYRELLNRLPFLEPASVPHDVDFEAGGDEAAWKAANARFRRNCYRIERAINGPVWTRIWTKKDRLVLAGTTGYIEGAYVALMLGSRDAFHWDEETRDIEENGETP